MRRMFFKPKYMNFILSGKKDLEGRVGYGNIKSLKVGDIVALNGKHEARIVGRFGYPTFEEAVSRENFRRLIPDARSVQDAIRIYSKLYPLWKQRKLGVIVFEFRLLEGKVSCPP